MRFTKLTTGFTYKIICRFQYPESLRWVSKDFDVMKILINELQGIDTNLQQISRRNIDLNTDFNVMMDTLTLEERFCKLNELCCSVMLKN